MLLMGASCCVALGYYANARKMLSLAEAQFNTQTQGLGHPYYYCIFLSQVSSFPAALSLQ